MISIFRTSNQIVVLPMNIHFNARFLLKYASKRFLYRDTIPLTLPAHFDPIW